MDGPTAPPRRWHTREESGLKLDRQGRWWHDGELIEHPKIVEAFNRGLTPAEDGRYRLQFGWDWCFVEVEDAAYQVLAVELLPEARVSLQLSNRTDQPLDVATLELDEDGVLRCGVMGGRAKARFSRAAQLELGSHLEEVGGRLVLRIGEARLPVSIAGWPA